MGAEGGGGGGDGGGGGAEGGGIGREDNRINQQVTEMLSCHLTLRRGSALTSQVCASARL